MKRSAKKLSVIELAAVGFMVFSCAQPVSAGNTTSVSSTSAAGWVYSDLVYGTKIVAQRGSTTSSITKPASAVNYGATNTYAPTGNSPIASNLPPGAITAGATTFFSQATTVYLTGGWKGQARTKVASPATAENPALQAELIKRGFVLPGAKCGAEYDIASGGETNSFGKKFLVVYGTATEGTAAWFQGFAGGKKLYDVLITGPFDFGDTNNTCNALRIPFDYNGDIDDVTFLADTVAITDTTLAIIGCPTSLDLECGEPLDYDGISVSGGCGNVDVTYSPARGTVLLPGTTEVTITATDEAYNQKVCTFDVTVQDTQAPVPTTGTAGGSLPAATGQCSATVSTAPTATDNCDGIVTATGKIGTTAIGLPYTKNTQGTVTITWTYVDGIGNTTTQTQAVTVQDTQAPVPTTGTAGGSLPAATGQCSATVSTAPTATDNCDGIVTATGKIGTTAIGLPYTKNTQGTVTITWTYVDGIGNTTTQTQAVTVQDTTPPVFSPSSLETKTGDCTSGPISLTNPGVTDNCPGTITVVANPVGPYSSSTTVTWTATDAAGNSSQATQEVVINGYKFSGFDDPIGGMGGTCGTPLPTSTASAGSSVQIKFGVLDCNGANATGIVPHVRIYKETATCTEILEYEGDASVINGRWHYQWNTSKSDKGKTFRIGVSLETSTQVDIPGTLNFGSVFIKLK